MSTTNQRIAAYAPIGELAEDDMREIDFRTLPTHCRTGLDDLIIAFGPAYWAFRASGNLALSGPAGAMRRRYLSTLNL